MKKWILALIIIIILAVIAFFLFSEKTQAAQLYLNGGTAQVLRNNNQVTPTDGMKLKLNDIIKVIKGEITIVFYDSDILRLEQGAEVQLNNLEKNINIKQNSGNSWSRILGLAGVKKYSIKTPNSVATVRGTGFAIIIKPQESTILVGEGIVDFEADGKKETVNAQEKAEFKLQQLKKSTLTLADKEIINKHLKKDILTLKKIRNQEIEKRKITKEIIKKSQGWNEQELNNYIEEVDNNKRNIDELTKKSPVKLKKIQKIVDLTKKIQEFSKNNK